MIQALLQDQLVQLKVCDNLLQTVIPILKRFHLSQFGTHRYADLEHRHVEMMMDAMADTPAAANTFYKLKTRLWKYATVHHNLKSPIPTLGVPKFSESSTGYYTWNAADIAKIENFHGIKSKAVLALWLGMYLGTARSDIIKLGWKNIDRNRISYCRQKTGPSVSLNLELMPQLCEVLEFASLDQFLFLMNQHGRPFTDETFRNWFPKCRNSAGLNQGSIHGLRKAGAVELAENGASQFEIMTCLAHKTPHEAARYVKAANHEIMADNALRKRQNVSNLVVRLDNYRDNSLKG